MSTPYAPFKNSREFLNSFNLPIQSNVRNKALTVCEHNAKKQIIKETYLNGQTSKLGDDVIQKKGIEKYFIFPSNPAQREKLLLEATRPL